MASRLALAVLGAFSISLLAMGAGQAAVCDPHCSPSQSNKGGELRGLNRANEVAGEHGQHGRDNAAEKQDLHKPGGSGVSTPPPVPPPPVLPPPVPPPVTPPPGPCTGC
jgi:hypothetical protein